MPLSHALKLVPLLVKSSKTFACAESCTGGQIAAAITSVAGCSKVFMGGVVSYSNASKVDLLGVDKALLDKLGAVCMETAEQMAQGALDRFSVDCAVATTGIAGPGGGSEAKPVGLVFIAWADESGVRGERFLFSGNRSQIQLFTISHCNSRVCF